VIGILTAVREELRPILRKMPSVDVESAGGILFHRGVLAGKPVVVARSGMGEERARLATRTLIERYRPDSMLAAGFGGGLAADVLPGELVVATEVAGRPSEARQRAGAERVRLRDVRIHAGPLVSSPGIVHTIEEKRALAARFPEALALDMESAGVADEAVSAGIPWLAVRAVTDGREDAMPELVEPFRRLPAIDPGTGEVIPARMALMVVLRPRVVPELVRLGGRAARAARNLADFVESYVAEL
jgi:adenosylhomocysteine nucleosidase